MSKWSKEQIQKEIEEMDSYLPVSKIEEKLGMPPTTLQKVLSGTRELPKKWEKVLEVYFVRVPENNKPENKVRIEEERNTEAAHSKHKKSLPIEVGDAIGESKVIEVEEKENHTTITGVKKSYDYSKMPKGLNYIQQMGWKERARQEQDSPTK